jgi:hypothetical protein
VYTTSLRRVWPRYVFALALELTLTLTFCVVTQPTDAINKLIFDGLSTIRGKLVNESERIISAVDLYPPADCALTDDEKDVYVKEHAAVLLDDTNLSKYALHGYDPDREKILVFSALPFFDLHEDFWFGRNSPFLDSQSQSLISSISWHMYSLTGAAVSNDFVVSNEY